LTDPCPNLAKLGWKRLVGPPEPDMETLRRIRSPLIAIVQFLNSRAIGAPTSGYREEPGSTHGYGFAMDYGIATNLDFADEVDEMSRVFGDKWARGWEYATRLGIYPHRRFVHIDVSPPELIEYLNKWHFWHEDKSGTLHGHDTLQRAIEAAKEGMK
jgi:hypothetical protein